MRTGTTGRWVWQGGGGEGRGVRKLEVGIKLGRRLGDSPKTRLESDTQNSCDPDTQN